MSTGVWSLGTVHPFWRFTQSVFFFFFIFFNLGLWPSPAANLAFTVKRIKMREEHSLIPSSPSCPSRCRLKWPSGSQSQLIYFITRLVPLMCGVTLMSITWNILAFHCILAFFFMCVCVCVCVSLPEVFREGRCVRGAGGSSRGGPRSGKPADRLGVAADEEPSCLLAARHRRCHHGIVSALWPQCGTLQFHVTHSG